MRISNYKETREAYTALLEKIVDASLRMGLELNLRQQSALAMLLEGASYNDIAQSFNISRSDAVIITNDAVNELTIHHMPISPTLMSILFKAGYITLDDVAKEDRDVFSQRTGGQ